MRVCSCDLFGMHRAGPKGLGVLLHTYREGVSGGAVEAVFPDHFQDWSRSLTTSKTGRIDNSYPRKLPNHIWKLLGSVGRERYRKPISGLLRLRHGLQ